MKKILLISLKTTQPPLLLFNVLNLFKRVLEFNVMTTVKLPSLNIYLDPQSVVEIHKLRQIYQTHNKTFQWNGMCEMLFEFVYIDICLGTHLLQDESDSLFHATSEVKLYSSCAAAVRSGHVKRKDILSLFPGNWKKQNQILHKSSEPRMRTL